MAMVAPKQAKFIVMTMSSLHVQYFVHYWYNWYNVRCNN